MQIILLEFKEYDEQFDTISTKRVFSDGTDKIDTSFYTGSGGIVYVYFKLYQYFASIDPKSEETIHIEKRFLSSLKYNIDLVE